MGSGSTTSKTTVPQWMQDYSKNTVLPFAQNIANTPFQAYGGDMTVDASPYSGQAAGQFDNMAGIAGMNAGDFNAMNQENMNPYQQNVIDTSMAGMRNAYNEAGAGLQAQVAGSGAFGNDRRGVMEGQLGADYALGAGQMEAGLRQQGYANAQAQTMAQLQSRLGAAGGAASGYNQLAGTDMALQSQNQANQLQEFMRQQNDPYQKLGALTGASAAMPNISSTTQTKKNGLLDYLTVGATIAASDRRLKTNIIKIGEQDGINFYSWDWNEDGLRVADPSQPTSGVMADEIQVSHPQHVHLGADGFMRVDYAGLAGEFTS